MLHLIFQFTFINFLRLFCEKEKRFFHNHSTIFQKLICRSKKEVSIVNSFTMSNTSNFIEEEMDSDLCWIYSRKKRKFFEWKSFNWKYVKAFIEIRHLWQGIVWKLQKAKKGRCMIIFYALFQIFMIHLSFVTRRKGRFFELCNIQTILKKYGVSVFKEKKNFIQVPRKRCDNKGTKLSREITKEWRRNKVFWNICKLSVMLADLFEGFY